MCGRQYILNVMCPVVMWHVSEFLWQEPRLDPIPLYHFKKYCMGRCMWMRVSAEAQGVTPPELELQGIVSCVHWLLRTEFGCFLYLFTFFFCLPALYVPPCQLMPEYCLPIKCTWTTLRTGFCKNQSQCHLFYEVFPNYPTPHSTRMFGPSVWLCSALCAPVSQFGIIYYNSGGAPMCLPLSQKHEYEAHTPGIYSNPTKQELK